ncbi:sulfite reductase subunit A [Marinicaulis flavus]|uniref:Sulfite reductase subunit A n=2 Tax=Hyphococcus luteus TaxID=2058213 RepID=A0A2S7K232_9PROT|nr:sulfite reductase subunit A [Marinicaulis flavus]
MLSADQVKPGAQAVLSRADFDHLITVLQAEGYDVIGPTVDNGAVVYQEIDNAGALPEGVASRQAAGRYRLEKRADNALFGYIAGAQSWRPYLFQPSRTVWRAEKSGDELSFTEPEEPAPKMAFLGMRACELAAIELQDRVFMNGDAPDPDYAARRSGALFIAVNCGEAGETCFCVSMDTGPKVTRGHDLVLTELIAPDAHDFLVEIETEAGAEIARKLPLRAAEPQEVGRADAILAETAQSMGRALDTNGLKEILQDNQDAPQWGDVAERCLSCANCTLVCPTCFCNTTEDVTALDGESAERRQRWASCFNLDFSYLHGGPVRPSVEARYRQWMTHKLAHWIDQFGDSGCVGCGRCISWCPASIDITEEAAALRRHAEEADNGEN